MKKYFVALLLLSSLSFVFTSCKDKVDPEPEMPYSSGVFISNEGVFQTGTGTISFYNRTTKKTYNNIFQTVNGRPLGNIVSDIELFNDKGYIVVNNAQKVEIVTYEDFKSVGTIEGLDLPSQFLGIDNSKAYVSQWGPTGTDGSIQVVDLTTNTISKSIATGSGSGNMIMVGNFVYVANGGGFGYDQNVTVINTQTDQVEKQILVGYNPNSLVLDANGMIWVMCGGKWKSDWSALEETGKLVKIDPSTNEVVTSVDFSSIYSTPKDLEISKDKSKLFFIYKGSVFSCEVNDALNYNVFSQRSFNSIGIDPSTDFLYGGDAKDYVSNGFIYRFKMDASLIDSFEVGIIPGDYYFN